MELDLRKLIEILLRRWWIICAALIFGAMSAFLITTFFIDPVYSAKATLYVYNSENRQASSTITSSDISVSKTLVDTYIVILKSDAVLNDVAKQTGLDYSAESIRKMISASSVNNTEVFQVTIENTNPSHAQIIANTLVEVAPPQIIRVVHGGSVEVIDSATLPTVPSSPNTILNTVIGGLLGLIIAVMGVLLYEMLDTRIKTENDLTEIFTIPVIGVIPSINLKDSPKKAGVRVEK
jgi:capsular polysaccharide biosynthesis protein